MSVRATAAGVIAAAAIVMLAAGPASAHALLQRSDPPKDAQLKSAPRQISLTFTEPPDPTLSRVDVLDTVGHPVTDGRLRVAAGDPQTLIVPLRRSLPDGVYTVAWQTTSEVDGHTTGQSFAFGVGVSPVGATLPSTAALSPRPTPLSVAGRWLLYAGLAILLSTGLTVGLVFPRVCPSVRWLLPSAWLLAASGLVMTAAAAAAAAGVSLPTFLGAPTGSPTVRQAIALGITGIASIAAIERPSRRTLGVVAGAAAVALLFHAVGSHAGAHGTWRSFNVLVQWVHLLAVGTWIGGLVWLLAGVRELAGAEARSAIRRFSILATVSIVLVLVTGTLRSVDLLGGWGDLGRLLSTGWGNALAWKLLLFAALAALGAWNHFVSVPRLERRGDATLRRSVWAELVLAAAVFGVTGVLAGLPPAAYAQATGLRPIMVSGHDFATSVRVQLTVTPGTPGPNTFTAGIVDYDTGKPVPAEHVSLRFSLPSRPDVGGSTMSLRQAGRGAWNGTGTALSISGTWDVTVLVQGSTDSVEVPLRVSTRATPTSASPTPTASTSVQQQQGLPTLYTVTLTDGTSVQAYVDPPDPGPSEVHFTAFDADGDELPLASARARAVPPSGTSETLASRKLSPGHVVADVHLTSGPWTFSLTATTRDGEKVDVSFREQI